jgi:hypothetical protein
MDVARVNKSRCSVNMSSTIELFLLPNLAGLHGQCLRHQIATRSFLQDGIVVAVIVQRTNEAGLRA